MDPFEFLRSIWILHEFNGYNIVCSLDDCCMADWHIWQMAWQPCLRQSWHHRLGCSGKNRFSVSRLSLVFPYSLTFCLFVSDYALVFFPSFFLSFSLPAPLSLFSLSLSLSAQSLLKGSPAQASGMIAIGDYITAVNGQGLPIYVCMQDYVTSNVQALLAPSQSLAETLH